MTDRAIGDADVSAVERFELGLRKPVTTHRIEVAGAAVSFRRWDNPGARPVILVHGGGAHARWWDGVAPYLTGGPIAAMDLTGHGDSDHRDAYAPQTWADELRAVVRSFGPEAPVVVGHSMGGLVSLMLASDSDPSLRGVVLIDSPLNDDAPVPDVAPALGRPRRFRDSAAELEARFRPILDSGQMPEYVRRHVARHSIRSYDEGYGWKFDPAFHRSGRIRDVIPAVPACPIHYLRPDLGLATDQMVALARRAPGGESIHFIEMAGVGHNPMLERPDALTSVIQSVI